MAKQSRIRTTRKKLTRRKRLHMLRRHSTHMNLKGHGKSMMPVA